MRRTNPGRCSRTPPRANKTALGPGYDANPAKSPPGRGQTTDVRPERGKNSSNLRPKLKPANGVRLRPVHGYSVTKHDDNAAILEQLGGDKQAKTGLGIKFVTAGWNGQCKRERSRTWRRGKGVASFGFGAGFVGLDFAMESAAAGCGAVTGACGTGIG